MNTSGHKTFRLSEDEWQRAKACVRRFLEEQSAARNMTDYSEVEAVVREAPLIVDFRGVTRGIEAPNLVRL